MTRLKYTFKTDTLFKLIFVKYPELLKKLVAALLSIRLESIGEFVITNPEIPPDSLGEKFCRLDINMTVNGQRVALEVQVEDEKNYPERVLYYWAREYSSALPAGGNYLELPRTIIINIVNFPLFDCAEFYSEFQALEVTRHTPLTDKMSVYFFELPKLPKLPKVVSANDELKLWLSLFNANTEEDLKRLEALEVPDMEQAIEAYRQVSATDRFKEIERQRSIARHNEASALRHAADKATEKERQKWQGVVAKKEAALAKKDSALAEKDSALAEKDSENVQLRAQIEALQARLGEDK